MRLLLLLASTIFFGVTTLSAADSNRPGAPHLFPHDVLAYARIDDMADLRKASAESQFGRLLNDPDLKPLVGDLYTAAAELFEQVGSEMGLTLDELLSIPDGEVAIAVIPFEAAEDDGSQDEATKGDSPEAIRARIEQRRRRGSGIGMIGILETGDKSNLLTKVLDRLSDQMINDGYASSTEEVEDTEVRNFRASSASRPSVAFCQREGVTLFGLGEGVVADALKRWKGERVGKTLAQNDDFAAVMAPCIGAEETEPQLTFFINPYGFGERFIKARGGAAALFWPIIEDLGLAKLKGIGGSSFTGGELFDGILHVHVLVQSPRDGFFAVLRPESGDINPPKWVPEDVSSYTTVYWDLPNAYAGLGRILDRFQGEDSLPNRVEQPFKQRTEIDLKTEIIEQLSGRVTSCLWYEPPARVNSQSRLIGMEVKDAAKAAEVMEKLAVAFPNQMTREDQGSTVVYVGRGPQRGNFPENVRRPEPRIALLGNEILFSDSQKLLERAIRAHGGAVPRLTGVPEYDLVASEVGGKLDGQPPFLFSFTRSQEMLRQFYEMAASPGMKEQLRRGADANPVAAKLSQIMEQRDLPPFDTLSKYFMPTGAFAYDSPTGIHYTTFTLRGSE